jgi:hypothetical protein
MRSSALAGRCQEINFIKRFEGDRRRSAQAKESETVSVCSYARNLNVAYFPRVSRACNTTVNEGDQKNQNTQTILGLLGSRSIRCLGREMQPWRHEARPTSRLWSLIRRGAFDIDSHSTSKNSRPADFFSICLKKAMRVRFPARSDPFIRSSALFEAFLLRSNGDCVGSAQIYIQKHFRFVLVSRK